LQATNTWQLITRGNSEQMQVNNHLGKYTGINGQKQASSNAAMSAVFFIEPRKTKSFAPHSTKSNNYLSFESHK
jgi:hypothetical protein